MIPTKKNLEHHQRSSRSWSHQWLRKSRFTCCGPWAPNDSSLSWWIWQAQSKRGERLKVITSLSDEARIKTTNLCDSGLVFNKFSIWYPYRSFSLPSIQHPWGLGQQLPKWDPASRSDMLLQPVDSWKRPCRIRHPSVMSDPPSTICGWSMPIWNQSWNFFQNSQSAIPCNSIALAWHGWNPSLPYVLFHTYIYSYVCAQFHWSGPSRV